MGTRLRHPNDLDRKRIERAIQQRKRYRYVTPCVQGIEGGYLIESPCCSRNIDPEGGTIDVARLEFHEDTQDWRLYRKDHEQKVWRLHSNHDRLHELLAALNADPERTFWQ